MINLRVETTRTPRRPVSGFTLVELLVVIAIIALLLGILVPAVISGRRAGEEASSKQFMAALSVATTTYQQDSVLGLAYPPSDAGKLTSASGRSFGLTSGSFSGWAGGEILAQALLGYSSSDGKSGLGFRKSGGSAGTVYGPYVEPDTKEVGDSPNSRKVFMDYWLNPICYYRVSNGQTTASHNDDIDGSGPDFANNDSVDEIALRAAPFVLYSQGIDAANSNAEEREDDIVVMGSK